MDAEDRARLLAELMTERFGRMDDLERERRRK